MESSVRPIPRLLSSWRIDMITNGEGKFARADIKCKLLGEEWYYVLETLSQVAHVYKAAGDTGNAMQTTKIYTDLCDQLETKVKKAQGGDEGPMGDYRFN